MLVTGHPAAAWGVRRGWLVSANLDDGRHQVSVIDLHGFVSELKGHASDHGFHIHDERHFVETYSNRQIWEISAHLDGSCGGPLELVVTLQAEARKMIAFEDEVSELEEDEEPDDTITLPLEFSFVLPPLMDEPDLLVLATSLAGVGGRDLPVQVSSVQSYEAVSDRPECMVNIVGRVEWPLAKIFLRESFPCDLLERANDICKFLLDRAPAWLNDS